MTLAERHCGSKLLRLAGAPLISMHFGYNRSKNQQIMSHKSVNRKEYTKIVPGTIY